MPLAPPARQSTWLAVLIGAAASALMLPVFRALRRRFPETGTVHYSRKVFGRLFGTVVALIYIFYAEHLGGLILFDFGVFLSTTILPRTPIAVISWTLLVVGVYAVKCGLEPIARASIFISIWTGLVTLFVCLAALPFFRGFLLQPVLDEGWATVAKGSFAMFSFPFGEMALLHAFFGHHVRREVKQGPIILGTVGVTTLFFTLIAVVSVGVLGPDLVNLIPFPVLDVVHHVHVSEFVTRIEALMVTTWVSVGFLKHSLCLYAACTGLADLLGLTDYRPLVLPLGSIMASLSTILHPNVADLTRFANGVYPVYALVPQVILPLLLLIWAVLRGFQPQKGQQP